MKIHKLLLFLFIAIFSIVPIDTVQISNSPVTKQQPTNKAKKQAVTPHNSPKASPPSNPNPAQTGLAHVTGATTPTNEKDTMKHNSIVKKLSNVKATVLAAASTGFSFITKVSPVLTALGIPVCDLSKAAAAFGATGEFEKEDEYAFIPICQSNSPMSRAIFSVGAA